MPGFVLPAFRPEPLQVITRYVTWQRLFRKFFFKRNKLKGEKNITMTFLVRGADLQRVLEESLRRSSLRM